MTTCLDISKVNFPSFEDDVPRSTFHGVYILFNLRVSCHMIDFNARHKILTA